MFIVCATGYQSTENRADGLTIRSYIAFKKNSYCFYNRKKTVFKNVNDSKPLKLFPCNTMTPSVGQFGWHVYACVSVWMTNKNILAHPINKQTKKSLASEDSCDAVIIAYALHLQKHFVLVSQDRAGEKSLQQKITGLLSIFSVFFIPVLIQNHYG